MMSWTDRSRRTSLPKPATSAASRPGSTLATTRLVCLTDALFMPDCCCSVATVPYLDNRKGLFSLFYQGEQAHYAGGAGGI